MEENKRLFLSGAGILVFILLVTFSGMIFFKQQIDKVSQSLEATEYREYSRYYVMIVEDAESDFWKAVYRGASAQAEQNDACVELFNDTFEEEYSREELMRIAIESRVDGIIIEADESAAMTACINDAVAAEIPVITVLGDNTTGTRKSFVGVGSYNLGREYGRQVLALCEEAQDKKETGYTGGLPADAGESTENAKADYSVYVLMDTNTENISQNILYYGIQETIEGLKSADFDIALEMYAVNNESRFAAEESIRDIFMDEQKLPDIIICLDELNTSCVYQAVVDYNRVGEVGVIGYYNSPDILRAIERKVVYSTITIDTAQMGGYCVEALNELYEYGNVSEYFAVDTQIVNEGNIGIYLEYLDYLESAEHPLAEVQYEK